MNRRLITICLAVLATAVLADAQVVRLGAIGDSLSDEYFEQGYGAYARCWSELLVEERGLDMGPRAADAGQPGGTWGEPRRTGYEDNWARYGATTDDAVGSGQHTGLTDGVTSRGVSHGVVFIGGNDFSPWSGAYAAIYDGSWGQSQVDAWVASRLANLETLLAPAVGAGARIVLASVMDFSRMPYVSGLYPDPVGQDRVAAALAQLADGIRALATRYRLGYLDMLAFNQAIFGPNSVPRSVLLVGNVAVDVQASGDGSDPAVGWVADGIHPHTVIQGIWANAVLTAFNAAYGACVPLFSEAEILANAGLSYGGADTLLTEIGPLDSYVTRFSPGSSLRFHGNGVSAPELDRVVIPLDAPHRPVDVGATDFTVELWLKAMPGDNGAVVCNPGNDAWIWGNIVLDRDVYGNGDWGDWGMSLMDDRVAFGVGKGVDGATVCGTTVVATGTWHHVAVTRRSSDGRLELYVDGALDGTVQGPVGDVSYRDGRTGFQWDPFLVVGAEKHDAGAQFPSYSGWVDEVRVSPTLRYASAFSPPAAAFTTDSQTAALHHFDEGVGDLVCDASGAVGGPSHGTRLFGGTPPGPEWSADTPFDPEIFNDGFESGDLAAWSSVTPPAVPTRKWNHASR